MKKRLLLSNIFQYASAQYFSQFIGFFTSVLLRKFLGPFSFGIWNMLKLILDYAGYANLGTISTVAYKVPLSKGQGKSEDASKISQVVFNFISLVAFSCSLMVLLYAFIWGKSLSREIFVGLIFIAGLLVIQRVYTYYITLLRANKDFDVLAKSIIFDALVNLLFTLTVVWVFGLYGFYFAIVIMPVLNLIFIRRYITYGLKFSFNLSGIIKHIRYGFPLFVSSILNQLLNSVDRIMIVSMLGLEQLGFYSIALMTKSYGTGVSKNFSIVIQPHFLEDFDQNDHGRSFRHAEIYSQVNAFFMCILLSLVFIFIAPLVHYVLPKFVPGILATRIYLLAILFLTITPYMTNILVALNRHKFLILISGLAICINVGLNFFLIKRGFGIAGASMATVVSSFFAFVMAGTISFWGKQRAVSFLMLIGRVFFPIVCCASVLWGVSFIKVEANILLESVLRGMAFSLSVIPLILYFEKKFGILRIIFREIIGKFRKKRAT